MNIEIFKKQDVEIRGFILDHEPYFVGKDIAEALGYNDTKKAIERHVDNDDKRKFSEMSMGDVSSPIHKEAWIIDESGMYSLIFGSKLESSKEFKKWVTKEVLPSIRKTGSYSKKLTPLQHMEIANQMLLEENILYEKKLAKNKKLIANLNLIEYSSHDTGTTITIEEFCKIVSDAVEGSLLGRTKAYIILRSLSLVMQGNTTPTQQGIARGYLNYVKHDYGYMTVIYTHKANSLIKLMVKHLQENESLNEALGYPFEPLKRGDK